LLLFFISFISTSDKYHEEVDAMNDPSPDLINDANIHHLLNEKHLSYRELFRRLDKNHDGKIEFDELIKLLEKVGVETSTKNRWTIARVSVDFVRREMNFVFHRELLIRLVDYPMHLFFHLNNLLVMY
jgi:hypothetical protein